MDLGGENGKGNVEGLGHIDQNGQLETRVEGRLYLLGGFLLDGTRKGGRRDRMP